LVLGASGTGKSSLVQAGINSCARGVVPGVGMPLERVAAMRSRSSAPIAQNPFI